MEASKAARRRIAVALVHQPTRAERGTSASVVSRLPRFLGALSFDRVGMVTWSSFPWTSVAGTKYRIVVSSDLWPIQCWTVRTSKPARSMRVAYVERNVFRSNLAGSSPARLATAFARSSICCSRLPVGEGNTKEQFKRRVCFLSSSTSSAGCRDFPLLPTLGIESEFRLGGHSNRPQVEIDVAPEQVHHFLFPKSSQQERRE